MPLIETFNRFLCRLVRHNMYPLVIRTEGKRGREDAHYDVCQRCPFWEKKHTFITWPIGSRTLLVPPQVYKEWEEKIALEKDGVATGDEIESIKLIDIFEHNWVKGDNAPE